MRHVTLPGGETVPALGLGTWRLGEDRRRRSEEATVLRAGLDLGLTVLDTAEMYADGGAEEVVAEAVAGRRDNVFIVSKVLPQNATRKGTVAACERSLARLATDRIDLYLLHWRGSHPLGPTVEAFEDLRRAGKIRHWGVSNLDRADMVELAGLPDGRRCAADQVLYHLGERGIEWDLLPALRQAGIVTMAYCPLGQGALLGHQELAAVAAELAVAPATVALAWLTRDGQVMAIPKTSRLDRLEAIVAAQDLVLPAEALARLDAAFPPPSGPSALATT